MLKQIKIVQREGLDISVLCENFENSVLPSDDKVAWRTVLESERYEIIQGVLHFEPSAFLGQLCVVVPKSLHETLLC